MERGGARAGVRRVNDIHPSVHPGFNASFENVLLISVLMATTSCQQQHFQRRHAGFGAGLAFVANEEVAAICGRSEFLGTLASILHRIARPPPGCGQLRDRANRFPRIRPFNFRGIHRRRGLAKIDLERPLGGGVGGDEGVGAVFDGEHNACDAVGRNGVSVCFSGVHHPGAVERAQVRPEDRYGRRNEKEEQELFHTENRVQKSSRRCTTFFKCRRTDSSESRVLPPNDRRDHGYIAVPSLCCEVNRKAIIEPFQQLEVDLKKGSHRVGAGNQPTVLPSHGWRFDGDQRAGQRIHVFRAVAGASDGDHLIWG